MEINFNVFLGTLQRITFPTTTQTEVSRILVIFQHEMTIHFFSPFTANQYEYNASPNELFKDEKEKNKNKSVFIKQSDYDEKLIIAPMKTIWQIFFEAYRIQPSKIRLTIARSVSIFLTRMMPFYPEQLSQSFAQTIRCLSFNEVQSSLVIASFTFIAHELSPPLLNDFLSSCSNLLIQIHPTESRSLPSISSFNSPFSFTKSKESSPSKSTIFDHFSISSNNLSEHIAPIITKLGFVGHDWLHQLLAYFLDNVQPQPGRHTIHAILATIGHYPKEFLKEAIETLKKKNIRDYISIFSLFFYSCSTNFKTKWITKQESNEDDEKVEGCFLYDNEIDITCFIDIAFDILKEQNMQHIDDALQILTILSDLDVHLMKNNEKVERNQIQTVDKSILAGDSNDDDYVDDDYDKQNMIVVFNYRKANHNVHVPAPLLIHRSTFYRLSLPIGLLKPNKNENILVSSSKFHTLAYYAKEISNRKHIPNENDNNEYMIKINIDEITSIFKEVFSCEYNEFVSSAYQAISSCFNEGSISLYKETNDNIDPTDFHMNLSVNLIRHILFCPMVSWFHSIDVLKFIRTLNLNKIDSSLAVDIVGILIDFSLNKNSKLSVQASTAIMNFVTPDNCVEIIQKLVGQFTFFDNFIMEKLLPPITNIIKRFGSPPEFEYFLKSVIEIAPFLNDNYTTISLIFDLITVSGIENKKLLTEAIRQAYVYIVSLYEIATGKNWILKTINFNDVLNSKKPLISEIDLKNTDIITDPTDNIRTVFGLMRSSLNFVFTFEPLIDLDFDLNICERCFELFPLEVSRFIYKIVTEFPDKKVQFSHFYNSMKYMNDYKVYQIWCRIVTKQLIQNENNKDKDPDEENATEEKEKKKSSVSRNLNFLTTPTKTERRRRSKNSLLFVDKEEKYVETSSSGSGCNATTTTNTTSNRSKALNDAVSYLNIVCFHFFNTNGSDSNDFELISTFSVFSIFSFAKEKKKIIHILRSLPEDRLKTILYYAKHNELKGELLVNEFKDILDENKIDKIMHKENSFYPKFIEFKFNLNTKTDPDTLLMLSIHSGDENNVKKVLNYLKEKDMKIKIPDTKMKASISGIISKWLSKNQFNIKSNITQSTQQLKINASIDSSSTSSNSLLNSEQKDESQSVPSFKLSEIKFANDHVTFQSLIEALKFVSTEWKSVAIATIKKNSPDNLLFQLCSMEKVPKDLLINLCKIVELVKFDKNKLFNVCNMLLYEAKTTKRQRITMRLFTTSMMYAEMIPTQIVNSFVAELGNLITTLPFYELTLCIKTIGKVIQNPIELNIIPNKAKEEPPKRKILVPDVPQNPRIRRKSMIVNSSSSSDVIKNTTSTTSINSNESSTSISLNEEITNKIDLKKASSDFRVRRKLNSNIKIGSSDFDSTDYDLFNINKTIYSLQETSDLDDFLTSSCENFDLYEPTNYSKEKQKLVPPKPFMQFAERVRRKLNPTNYLYGNLQILFFQFTKPESSLIYAMDEEDNLVRYLETSIPSKFLIGMRQFSMRLKTMTNFDSDRFVKNIGRTILGKVFDFIELPFFTHLLMEGIIKPLLGSGHWNYMSESICRTLARVSFAAPHYMAIYPSILKWLPLGIRTTLIPEFYSVSASLFEEVSNPKAFSLGIQCLIEKLSEMSKNLDQEIVNGFELPEPRNSDDKKDELLMDSILVFFEHMEKVDSMYLTEYLMDLASVIARFSKNKSFITMIFTQLYKKSPRFFPAFAALAKFIKVSPQNEAIPTIIESIFQITDSDLKKKAIRLINNNDKIQEALILAQNSDKIIVENKEG